MTESQETPKQQSNPATRPLKERVQDTLLILAIAGGLFGFFIVIPVMTFAHWIMQDGLADTLVDMAEALSPILALLAGLFVWGTLRNTADAIKNRSPNAQIAQWIGLASTAIFIATVGTFIILMVLFWGDAGPIDTDCPWPGARC